MVQAKQQQEKRIAQLERSAQDLQQQLTAANAEVEKSATTIQKVGSPLCLWILSVNLNPELSVILHPPQMQPRGVCLETPRWYKPQLCLCQLCVDLGTCRIMWH